MWNLQIYHLIQLLIQNYILFQKYLEINIQLFFLILKQPLYNIIVLIPFYINKINLQAENSNLYIKFFIFKLYQLIFYQSFMLTHDEKIFILVLKLDSFLIILFTFIFILIFKLINLKIYLIFYYFNRFKMNQEHFLFLYFNIIN